MSITTVKVPDGAGEAEVIEICVAVGDTVAVEDSLVVLESDKASMEVPSDVAGVITAIIVKEGEHINAGDIVVEVDVASSAAEPVAEAAPAPVQSPVATPAETSAPVAAPVAAAEANLVVPDLGTDSAEIIEICVNVGDEVSEGDSLIVLETDKASMEVPASQAGKILSISVKEGEHASEGDVICVLMTQAQADPDPVPVAAPAPAPSPAAEAHRPQPSVVAAPVAEPTAHQVTQRPSGKVYAGPAVRKLAREFGVDLGLVTGTGPKGRLLKDDVQSYVKNALTQAAKKPVAAGVSGGAGIPPVPDQDFAKFGDIETEKLSKIAKLTAANMQRNWLNVPHVTQFDDVDITDLEDFRKAIKAEAEQQGVKLTPLPFMVKALAHALKANPKFCASLQADGEHIVYKKYVHIGMAVDTSAGLMVPVLRDADKKSVYQISKELAELADKAKNRKLKPAEMQGACFTISSLGGLGGTGFTPIVNAPEVGILGVSKMSVKPMWNGSDFVPRKMLPVALSYDHRAINGGDAGRFLTQFNQLLSDIRRLML